jgi:hypothetical protein
MGDRVQCVDVYDVGGEVLTAILANEDCEVETASLFLYLNGAFGERERARAPNAHLSNTLFAEDDPPQSAVQSEIEQLRRVRVDKEWIFD